MLYFLNRCGCKNCQNPFGQNDGKIDQQTSKRDQETHCGKFGQKINQNQHYSYIGLRIVKPRWTFQESLLLFLLMDRKVSNDAKSSTILADLQTRFNDIVYLKDVSQNSLNKKSIGQIESKITNLLRYVSIYDRNRDIDNKE